jgi:threonine/homoserine/homoserine lactone efflux protein
MIYLISESEQKSMLAYLLSGIAYGFAAGATPGPLSMFIISQAVSNGWRRTLPAAFSPLITDGPVALLVLAVLSQAPANMVLFLRLAGGTFILYLAFGAWKSWRSFDAGSEIHTASHSNSFLKAAAVNWLNPNLYIGWSVIFGPMVLSGWRESPINGIALVLGFYMTIITVMAGMILLFAAAGTLGMKVKRNLTCLSAIALAVLGFYQLWLGIIALRAAL